MKFLSCLFLVIGLGTGVLDAMNFVHPGAINSRAELDFVRGRIAAGAQPWLGELQLLQQSAAAVRTPHALRFINSKSGDANLSRDDATAAYAQALLWYFTGDERCGRGAIALLRAWSSLEGFNAGSDQDRLQAGWIGALFAPAAEIIRLHPEWTPADTQALEAMFRRAFYPQLTTASAWNGNVDLTQIDALLGIAVFNEDEAAFKLGVDRLRRRLPAYIYLTSDGPLPRGITGDGGNVTAFWFTPKKWVDGLTQESCRDNGHHTQFGLGSALHSAETAWHQGTDVYTENQPRFTAALELLAGQLLAGSMQGVAAKDPATPDRYDTWEIGYHHYHTRAGLNLPATRRLLVEQIRGRAPRADWNLAYETLTHAELTR